MNNLDNVYKNLKRQKRNKVIITILILLAFVFMTVVGVYFIVFDNVDSFLEKINNTETHANLIITKNDFTFNIVDGEAKITQYNGNSQNIAIPDNVDNIPVTAIKSIKNENVVSVSIPSSVIRIENDAFYHLKSLTTIKGGKNISYIGDRAFKGCTKLSDMTLYNQLHYIGEETFCNTGFKEIVIPNTITTLNTRSFNSCKNLEKITISKGVYVINKQCFKNCVNLKDVYCYVGTVNLGEEVFTNCNKKLTIYCLEKSDIIGYCEKENITYINKLK